MTPSDPHSPPSALGRFAVASGRALARATRAVGRKAASTYHSVDPDLRLHIAQLPLMGMSMLAPRAPTVEPLPPDGHRPLILVHGLGGHPGNFLALRAWLRLAGRRRVYLVDLGNSQSLEWMAEGLGGMVRSVADCNGLGPEDRVDIVAHSMGGLVARLAIEDPTVAERVALIVTAGTPHAGTWLARLGGTAPTTLLRPGSRVIDRLANGLPWRNALGRPRLVALWSRSDLLIMPPEGARVEGAENIEMPAFTHYSYLLDPDGWRMIQQVLEADESLHPQAA